MTSGDVAIRDGDRPCLLAVDGTADLDLGQHRRPLAVGDDLLCELLADPAEREREGGVGGGRPRDPARAVREQADRVVRGALAVDRDRVEAALDRGPEEVDRLARLERVVGREDGEHRRELRMDHPRALGHPADGEPVERDGRLLRLRVGREDRLGRVEATRGRERRHSVAQAAEHLLERQQRADHARGEDEHLLGVEVEQPPGLGGGRERVELAALAGGRVGDARVDHDRLRLGRREMLLRDDDRRGEDLVDGEHRRADRGDGRADDREVESLAPDTRVHAGGREALRRGDAHRPISGR